MSKHESEFAGGPTRPESIVDERASARPDPVEAPAGEASARESAELAAVREELQDTFNRYQRLAADFENFKRRTRQEMAERTQFANEELLRKLLPVLDNLKRALDHAPEGVDPKWYEGVKLVARQFEEILEAQGLAQIPAVGEKFDPTQHEAIAREETDAHEEGTVIEEMQPGYRLHNRVLRPTLVKVAHPRALPS